AAAGATGGRGGAAAAATAIVLCHHRRLSVRTDYAQIFQDPHVVERYEHEVYAPDSHASATSRRQQRYLRRLVRRWFREWPPVQHDFACGTGRGIRLLHGVVRAAHGYDPSAAMLAKARELDTPASLHLVAPDG